MKIIKQRVLTALFTAISVSALYIPSDSDAKKSLKIIDDAHHIRNPSNYNINSNTKLNNLLPSSFDLRNVDNMNFISPVKNQGGWGLCWSFASVAASEASAQYELWDEYGITPDELLLDFSELQLSWFAFTALQDEHYYPAQVGEGYYVDDDADVLDNVGWNNVVIALMASGVGPYDEKNIPYTSKSGNIVWIQIDENGKKIKDENGKYITETHPKDWEAPNNFVPYYIATKGEDWSVDIKERFNSKLRLEHANILPSPATYDENGNYIFDQNGLDAIKYELNIGHAVEIGFHGDNAVFDDLDKPPVYVSENYAHYTYRNERPNHLV